ncbi:TetR/AcrR family transcriptional regulator [Staphylococcus delphini]|uniref:TetR/AcrR family transcriptional regulator n=1 Tax=Staphylococcus delphini TaxID=53344 RepID=UPI0012D2C806|nr:TetR/AcrR family transcriptional regulator [Staphylococcus delphini]MTV19444.1 TetR family transcriptional regulator [Staphylococcus delphini]
MYSATQKRMRQHIIAMMLELLNEKQFNAITIQMICERAEINRSTFYRYFEDKYDLLYHVSLEISESVDNYAHSEAQRPFFYNMLTFMAENKKLFKNIMTTDNRVDIFGDLVKLVSRMMRDDAEQNVENNDPLIRQIREAEHPILMSDFYSSGLIEVLKQWLENDYQIDVEEMATTLEVIFKVDSSENQ